MKDSMSDDGLDHDAAGVRQRRPADAGDDEERMMPLLGGIATSVDLPSVESVDSGRPASRLLNNGTMLILLIFAIAAVMLYAMRASQGDLRSDGSVADVELRIETALKRLAGISRHDDARLAQAGSSVSQLLGDTDSVVSMFTFDIAERQVPIDYVKKNPFQLVLPKPEVVNADKPTGRRELDEKALAERQAIERQRKLDAEFAGLKLQTVMHGRVPVAVISGQFVKPGQPLGSFKVASIDKMSVTLAADDKTWTLKMD